MAPVHRRAYDRLLRRLGDIKLPFFPSTVTTWEEWVSEHPDTTVLSPETGIYLPNYYLPESDPDATYFDYFANPEPIFPVWLKSPAREPKEVVVGLGIGDAYKAYPIEVLQAEVVVNDTVGGTAVVVVASPESESARAYERGSQVFSTPPDAEPGRAPATLVDSEGHRWRVTEEALVRDGDPSVELQRIPTHTSFWFGWYQFHPETEIYTPGP